MQFVRWLMDNTASTNAYEDVELGGGKGSSAVAAPTKWRSTTCKVEVASDSGTKHFEFQCARFVLRKDSAWDAKFTRPQIVIGPKFSEILSCAEGLDERVANDRLDQIGPNTIPFKVDTVLEACSKEFFSYFYLYQLAIYTVWLWWSYLYVAVCMVRLTGECVPYYHQRLPFTSLAPSTQAIVVLASAAVNIYLSISNQREIELIAEYITEVDVLRDGKFRKLSSETLVPGDVIEVQGDWTLPCDLAIVEGAAICDESGLTGESRPVRKTAFPASEGKSVYDALHGGQRYTLFAGTKVLQSDRCKAVVVATGAATSKGELVSQILFPKKMTFKYDE